MYLGKMGTSSHFLSAFTIFVKFLPHKNHMDITILGIESSCDDTSAAVIRDRTLLSNVIASQAVHQKYAVSFRNWPPEPINRTSFRWSIQL